jgi:NAD(P)-dependent dehydrogenase (short-subunit alcohol dehydrogenase family)
MRGFHRRRGGAPVGAAARQAISSAGLNGSQSMQGSTNRKVATVFGGTGFIGRYVVQRLAALDYIVRVATSHPSAGRFLQTQGGVGQIVPLAASLTDAAAVARAVAGADLVVNLVGILAEGGAQSFTAVQDEGARTVAQASAASERAVNDAPPIEPPILMSASKSLPSSSYRN